ncbi:hypothetical protein BC828DRAFT_375518 [Blastocladiella britannica]|nr:hypothetical protein BC828DRAFT_375518 [Blastocladiella britannica]
MYRAQAICAASATSGIDSRSSLLGGGSWAPGSRGRFRSSRSEFRRSVAYCEATTRSMFRNETGAGPALRCMSCTSSKNDSATLPPYSFESECGCGTLSCAAQSSKLDSGDPCAISFFALQTLTTFRSWSCMTRCCAIRRLHSSTRISNNLAQWAKL